MGAHADSGVLVKLRVEAVPRAGDADERRLSQRPAARARGPSLYRATEAEVERFAPNRS